LNLFPSGERVVHFRVIKKIMAPSFRVIFLQTDPKRELFHETYYYNTVLTYYNHEAHSVADRGRQG